MKKAIHNLLPFTAFASIILASCRKSPVEITPEPGKVELSLVVDDTNVKEGAKIPFKITTTNTPQSNLTLDLEVSPAGILYAPQQLVLAEGALEVSSEAIAVAPGEATLSIKKIENVTLTVPSAKITVTGKD